jgi:hypothetical protein
MSKEEPAMNPDNDIDFPSHRRASRRERPFGEKELTLEQHFRQIM